MIQDRRMWIILAILVTEVLGFSLILPFLPFYAKTLGATPLIAGMLLTSFSLFQFITSPLMGQLSDRYGRKPLLIFSQLSTLAGFVILGAANQLWMLFASRIVDGLLGSNGTIAQAYMSDISTKKNRSKAFSVTGIAFGLGFMVGPAIGGWLAQIDYSIPAFIAAGLTGLSIVLTWLFLPETVDVKQQKQALTKISFKIFDWQQLQHYWQQPQIRQQLIELGTYLIAHVIFTSNFALYSGSKFGFGTKEIGLTLTTVGLVSVFMRAIVVPRLIDSLGEAKLEKFAVIAMIIGLSLGAFGNSWKFLVPGILLFAFGTGATRPLMMGDVSRAVPDAEQGAILGLANSINSFAQIIGPLVSGWLLTHSFTDSPIMLSIVILLIGFWMIAKEKKEY